jgi:hypothetical protein
MIIFLLARQIKFFNYNSSAWGDYASARNKLGLVTSLLTCKISQLKALKGSETEIETTTSLKIPQLPVRFFTAIRHHSSY